jgi:hypothetical protein
LNPVFFIGKQKSGENMNLLSDINGITVLIAGIFLIPIAAGVLYPSSADRIQHSFLSMLTNLELIAGILLTLYFYKLVFLDKNAGLLDRIYHLAPPAKEMMARYGHDFTYHIAFLFLCLFAVLILLYMMTAPFYRFFMVPLANKISAVISSLSRTAKRIVGGAWQLPKSVSLVLILSLILNFYTNVGYSSSAADYIGRSAAYTMINEKILHPLLGSSIAKKIPVLINDSFKEINETFYAGDSDNSRQVIGTGPIDSKFPIIEYFNGIALDEAVLSTKNIDQTAKKIVGTEKDNKKKASLLYQWICKNIQYDYDKAEMIVTSPSAVTSGSQVAFSERKGVCFDYSALYVSMCRAVGLKVRMVTGLGFSGTAWGDHAWNQVYYPEEKRWINVDTTFGSSGYNSFDSKDFLQIHKYGDVQEEW